MAPTPFTWEARNLGVKVAALMTPDIIRRRLGPLGETTRILLPGRCKGDLAALATELRGLGADVTERRDGLELRPARLHGGLFHSYADHRMAHAAAVLGSAVAGVTVDDVAATSKTFPDFPRVWSGLLGS